MIENGSTNDTPLSDRQERPIAKSILNVAIISCVICALIIQFAITDIEEMLRYRGWPLIQFLFWLGALAGIAVQFFTVALYEENNFWWKSFGHVGLFLLCLVVAFISMVISCVP